MNFTIKNITAVVAFVLAKQHRTSLPVLRIRVFGNWVWALVSVALLFFLL
jgi:hypothetical protein